MKKFILAITILMCGLIANAQIPTHELKGTVSGINVKNMDGLVDFALVIPGMNQEEIVQFNLGKVISPANDTLKVASYTIELPSNLSLPPQTEKYFISINCPLD